MTLVESPQTDVNKEITALEIQFPPAATIGAVSMLVEEAFKENLGDRPVELNFAKSTFIEIATLVYVIAVIADRNRSRLITIIKLPDSKSARDALRLWSFPNALSKVTGLSFRRIASKQEDQKYFGENRSGSEFHYASVYYNRNDKGILQLGSGRFFSLQVYELSGKREINEATTVVEESQRWNTTLVRTVLAKHLSGPNGYVSSRIVYESMTNAVRHSGANFIVAASRFDDASGSKGFLTLVYWDDGESMIDTLRAAITSGKPIRTSFSTANPDQFELVEEHAGVTLPSKYISSDFVPTSETTDELILLSTTFPGITRDITARGFSNPELAAINPEYDAPGMGLHVLLNTVIDVFKGSVSFRTKNYFMNIKLADKKTSAAKYRAKVHVQPASVPPFAGNMLTIRLPLNNGTE